MLEPATLLSSVLALVIGKRPVRTGSWFYVGGPSVTLLVGVVAAFVVGNRAVSHASTPRTWVSIVTVVAGALVLGYAIRLLPTDPRGDGADGRAHEQRSSGPALAIVAAGAALANPGVFMLIAAKSISQLNPSTAQYVLDGALFAVVALLPLALALVMLRVAAWVPPSRASTLPAGGSSGTPTRSLPSSS